MYQISLILCQKSSVLCQMSIMCVCVCVCVCAYCACVKQPYLLSIEPYIIICQLSPVLYVSSNEHSMRYRTFFTHAFHTHFSRSLFTRTFHTHRVHTKNSLKFFSHTFHTHRNEYDVVFSRAQSSRF